MNVLLECYLLYAIHIKIYFCTIAHMLRYTFINIYEKIYRFRFKIMYTNHLYYTYKIE